MHSHQWKTQLDYLAKCPIATGHVSYHYNHKGQAKQNDHFDIYSLNSDQSKPLYKGVAYNTAGNTTRIQCVATKDTTRQLSSCMDRQTASLLVIISIRDCHSTQSTPLHHTE